MQRLAASIATIFAMLVATVPSLANAPTTVPAVPPLVVGQPNPAAFVVDGSYTVGLCFHVACDGDNQLCAVFDEADGTPLFISDGHHSLIYDLMHSRIVAVPQSCGYVTLEFDPAKAKPLGMSCGVSALSDPKDFLKASSSFRVDQWLASYAPKLRESPPTPRGRLFIAENQEGKLESLEVNPADPSWYSFAVHCPDDPACSSEVRASLIGQKIPAEQMTFPDINQVKRSIELLEADVSKVKDYVCGDGIRAIAMKMAVAGGKDFEQAANEGLHHPDWEAIRARDKELGAKYRAALAQQGIRFSFDHKHPTTQAKK